MRFLNLLLLCLFASAAVARKCPELTIAGATLIAAPGTQPLEEATIVLRDGLITAVTNEAAKNVDACTLTVEGRLVTAGLWNSHVHFSDAAFASLEKAAPLLKSMLLRYGFTSVVDTGSVPATTLALRAAIAENRLPGPEILMASGGFVYRDGTPSYLPKGLLPELETATAAPAAVNAILDLGTEGIKIFSGSFQGPDRTVLLPPEIIRAITDAAHARGAFVVSHPTSLAGFVNAVDNGVDILAHTAPPAGKLEAALLARMLGRRVALIPTLELWEYELRRAGAAERIEETQNTAVEQLADYFSLGGEILFGTDVGYMQDYDPSDEYVLMHRAGLEFDDILRTLTVAPAHRFDRGDGQVRVGGRADLVVYDTDPRLDAAAFADIAYTIARGRVVYERQGSDSTRLQALSALATAAREEADAPALGLMVARAGEEPLIVVDGVRVMGQAAKVTAQDKWHWGSITKSMTATLVARLVEKGTVSWADTVEKRLGELVPEMKDAYRAVTFRHLLSHHSGLAANNPLPTFREFGQAPDEPIADRLRWVRIALTQEPVGPLETTYEYSNNGFIVAAAMLEAATGESWEALVQQQVFAPLGINDAGFGAPRGQGLLDQPRGHRPVGDRDVPAPIMADNPAALGPAGRVHMPLADMAKYLRAHAEQRPGFLRPESYQLLHTQPFGGFYAMGWVVPGPEARWHNGSNTMWYAEVAFRLLDGTVAAVVVNDGDVAKVRPVVSALLGKLLRDEIPVAP